MWLSEHFQSKNLFVCLFLNKTKKRTFDHYFLLSPALVSPQIMCNFNKSAKKNISIYISLYIYLYLSVVWARENTRACIVLEIMMCTVYWIVSDLCVSAKCLWCMVGEQRDGMALWSVGVDFLCGTVGLQLDILSTHMFFVSLLFLYLCHVNSRSRIAILEYKLTNQSDCRRPTPRPFLGL